MIGQQLHVYAGLDKCGENYLHVRQVDPLRVADWHGFVRVPLDSALLAAE